MTLDVSGATAEEVNGRWSTPGVSPSVFAAYEADPEFVQLPGGNTWSTPVSAAWLGGDPGAVIGWKREDGATEDFVQIATFYVYDDQAPLIHCGQWVDWIVVARYRGGFDTGAGEPSFFITFAAGGEDGVLDGELETERPLPEYAEPEGRITGRVAFDQSSSCTGGWVFADVTVGWSFDPDVEGRTEACPGGWFGF